MARVGDGLAYAYRSPQVQRRGYHRHQGEIGDAQGALRHRRGCGGRTVDDDVVVGIAPFAQGLVQLAFLAGKIFHLGRVALPHSGPVQGGVLRVGIGHQYAVAGIRQAARQQHGQGGLAGPALLIHYGDDFRAHDVTPDFKLAG